ncbi:glycoside hydrolase [Aureobasidium namibiae CBS 147.97]|uniref:Beta-xylanase n=1 Tax=Aureobasidium namibiae CBS 147.97 TaxID=1043004 RepID=A0A074WYL9_9PEZI|nr:glycoside hydrolase [Aureobasidium namibiae CBS 147.97]KEQ74867.1 glycoside hydrolase [Aureobasidium namibiae CBS 147.97]
MSIRSLLSFGLLAAPLVSALPAADYKSTSSASNTVQTTTLLATATGKKGLNDYAKKAGKLYFGTAADVPGTNETTDKYYRAELANRDDWGQVTPANAMKWVFTEPEQGVFNYTEAETFLADAAPPGRLVRCHNLNWYNQLPNWLTSGTWGKANLTAVLENHVTNLVKHFGDRCYAWDVVNEALSDSGTGNLADNSTWRSDIWFNTIGPEYVAIAFKAAEAAVKANKLSVKLYYNDYNIESAGNKSTAAQALVKSLKDAKIQIDGVGLQSHFIVGETPSRAAQSANMQAFASLNVDVAITELDIRAEVPPTAAAQQQQVLDYESSVGACADVDACVGITAWDFDDSYSWIPSTFPGQGYGDLFFQPGGYNTPLVRKAAYDGCIDVSPNLHSQIVSMLTIATGSHQLSSEYCQTNQSG